MYLNSAVPSYARLWLGTTPPAEGERLTAREQDKLFGWGLLAVVVFSSAWWKVVLPTATLANADTFTLGMALTGFVLGLKIMLELPRTSAAAMPGFGLLATALMTRGEQLAIAATAHWWRVLSGHVLGG